MGIRTIKGDMMASGRKFGIVVSRFNEFVSEKLVEGALDTLMKHGVSEDDVSVVWVPGSFELPMMASRMASAGSYDGVICLGTIIRGDTPHFDYVASEAAKGVAKVGMDTQLPCIFGVITADTLEQAIDRAGTKSGNKGRDAAMAAIEMCSLYSKL
jgi:6,7-dimethyl-8-ribityllumazine synthase